MGRRFLLVDDLDGSDADETLTFALRGKSYEIDLSQANADALTEALAPFMQAARSSGGTGKATARRPAAPGGGESLAETRARAQAIREWARSNGWPTIADRGRIPHEVEIAYAKRHEVDAPRLIATKAQQRDLTAQANEILKNGGTTRSGELAAGRVPVKADPFEQQRHTRDECENLDACPEHSGVDKGTPTRKASPSSLVSNEAILAWIKDHPELGLTVKPGRDKPTPREKGAYNKAHAPVLASTG